ncbi:MAG TPA: hypothetical protein VFE62_16145 [Gemmataceae bacterium]|nr:hypothetical protein [Gemmataceae bacterium]
MPINGYFDTLFAASGDKNTVPDGTQPSGTVSYQQGFPVLYSTPVSSGGYNVPRTAFNQVFYDITAAIQNWQQNTIAPFITTTMNGGTPYSYPQYALVTYGGVAYQSLVNSNTDTPPSSKWIVFNANTIGKISSTQTVTGTSHTFVAADNMLMTLRSNSGTLMTDTLPGTSPGVMALGWQEEIVNNDASALYFLSTGSGANLNGSSTGSIVLGPGQRAIVFSDGSNYWAQELPSRVRLGANTSFYVATTGSDSNNGLASGTPWATLQHAANYIQQNVDLGGFTATINVANGTYSSGVTFTGPFTGAGTVALLGNTGSPSSCIISTSAADCIKGSNSADLVVGGFKLSAASSGNGLFATSSAQVSVTGAMEYGSVSSSNSQIVAQSGGVISITASYTISGGGEFHWQGLYQGQVILSPSLTITLTGTPAFTDFAATNNLGLIIAASLTFSGSATGPRYNAANNGVINTQGGGSTYLPGNSAGATSSGGQYI